MKKICSMLLACMMILTGFSMPAFAADVNIMQGAPRYEKIDIKNISTESLKRLIDYVDKVFREEPPQALYADTGILFDGICVADLLSKHYNGKVSREYLAKKYLYCGEFVDYYFYPSWSYKKFELVRYNLKKALECLQGNEDPEVRNEINERVEKLNEDFINYVEEEENKKLGEAEKESKIEELDKSLPKTKKEYYELLKKGINNVDRSIYGSSEIIFCKSEDNIDEEGEVLDGKSITDYYNISLQKEVCGVNLDNGQRNYMLKDLIINVLLGNFEIGPGKNHIALGYIYRI